ncbi:MAG TPA: hypothetical protein ACFYEK_06885 [Candidatus Wunengus sp. YC60]|uniref:hypothetical protein n=1 Tax=Candidatus Wunengus sp. YC60 TaxID=3367697 RepID=UPI004024F188
MLDKIEKAVTEKSDKIMTNEKVERFVNNLGGMLCFIGAVVFGIMFIVGGASLMKTGKNYVVKPAKEEKKEAEASAESTSTEPAATEEAVQTEQAAPAEPSAE